MSINLHIFKASGRLNKFEADIKKAFDVTLKKIENKIDLPAVDIVIDDNVQATIPETGVGGSAPTAHILYIHLDPDFKDIKNKLDLEIKSTLAHELCHCARWSTNGYGETLLEALVSEGLADHFDIEINGGDPKPWNIAIQGKELENLKIKAREDFFNREYDHSLWFFGSGEMPRWAGYSLGYSLIGDYLKMTNKKTSELISKDAKIFSESWLK